MTPLIRAAQPKDIPAMVGLLGQLFQIEKDFFPDPEIQALGLSELLQSKAAVLVLEADGQVWGMVSLQPLVSTALGGIVGVLEDLVIHEDHRGQGWGELLLEEITKEAKTRGYHGIKLMADRGNAGALRFYGRLGYYATNLIPMFYEE